jgi:hypothetical protein
VCLHDSFNFSHMMVEKYEKQARLDCRPIGSSASIAKLWFPRPYTACPKRDGKVCKGPDKPLLIVNDCVSPAQTFVQFGHPPMVRSGAPS